MKWIPPGSEPITIGLTSGHTAVVHPDGSELDKRFHREAILKGCEPVDSEVSVSEVLDPAAPNKLELIRAAIEKMLDGDDEDAFNADGRPDVRVLSKTAGFNVTKGERDSVWDAMQKATGE